MDSTNRKEATMKRLTATLATVSLVVAVSAPVASAVRSPAAKAGSKAAVKQLVRPSMKASTKASVKQQLRPGMKVLKNGLAVRIAKVSVQDF